MAKITIGNLEFTLRFGKGAPISDFDLAMGYSRSANSYAKIFEYDCDTSTPTPPQLPQTTEFVPSLWCSPPTPMHLATTMLLTEADRRDMERRSAACERALIQASGLTVAEFGQAMEPHFPRVSARIPLQDIRRLIPKYTFKVYQTVHWIHVYCQHGIDRFPCDVFIRFPYAYDYDIIIEKACDGSAVPQVEIMRRYFELTGIEKELELQGQRIHERLKGLFNDAIKPEGH